MSSGHHDDRRPRAAGTVSKSTVGQSIEIALLILTGYGFFLYYNLIGHLSSMRGLDFGPLLLTPVDRTLPYLPALIWFYQMAYVVPAAALTLIAGKIDRNARSFRQIMLAFLALLFVHYAFYLLLPTSAASTRLAEEATGDGLLGALVRYQYQVATVWCAFPSLHVSACWYFYRVFARDYPRLRWIYLVWFIGMFLGTAGIKIHYVLDGIAGLALGETAYRLVFLRLERMGAFGWTWRSNTLRLSVYLAILAALIAGIPLLMSVTGYPGPLVRIIPGG